MYMNDLLGNEVKEGDIIILTVSKGSHYLTLGTIESLDPFVVRYSSTPKQRAMKPSDPFLLYTPKPLDLGCIDSGSSCIDCSGYPVSLGDKVAYRNLVYGPGISIGVVKDILDPLHVILEGGFEVRDCGLCVL